MQNYSLLREAGRTRKPVLLKRGMAATLEELLMAAEYIMSEGNYQVILCERGVRTFVDHTRNTLDLSIVPAVQRFSHLPIIVDPSHGTGKRNKVVPLARAAVAVGADGLVIEVHHQPDKALSDGAQSIYPQQFADMMGEIRQIARVLHRDVPDGIRIEQEDGWACGCEYARCKNQIAGERMTLQLPPRHSMNQTGDRVAHWLSCVLLAAALFSLGGCHSHEFPDYPANYREYAYITNGGSNTVTVLDVVNLRQDRVIRVGSNPTGVAANTKRNEVYVVNTGSNSVSVIDAEKNAVVATIPVHQRPYFISVSTDGTRAYVANSGSNNVSVIDLKSRREIAVVGVGEGPGVAARHPGRKCSRGLESPRQQRQHH